MFATRNSVLFSFGYLSRKHLSVEVCVSIQTSNNNKQCCYGVADKLATINEFLKN